MLRDALPAERGSGGRRAEEEKRRKLTLECNYFDSAFKDFARRFYVDFLFYH